MSKKALILLAIILAVLAVAIILPAFIRARTTPSENACINNLRQIDGAIQQWALENHKNADAIPTWEEIVPYLKQPVACPQGGTYTLGRVSDPPKCSVSEHKLP